MIFSHRTLAKEASALKYRDAIKLLVDQYHAIAAENPALTSDENSVPALEKFGKLRGYLEDAIVESLESASGDPAGATEKFVQLVSPLLGPTYAGGPYYEEGVRTIWAAHWGLA